MANNLPKEKQITIIGALAEGSSMRAISRMTGVHQDTICRLGVRIGQGCAAVLDAKMQDLRCNFLQFDEVWGFIGKKQKHVTILDDPTKGDVWTFCAIDAETKLVPAFKVGKRDHATAHAFVGDVASRLRNRPQISTDGLSVYIDAIEDAFGMGVDYGMVIKNYGHDTGEHHQERRYSAPAITFCEKRSVAGHPDMDLICTSHVERLNGITRLHMRRLTRLTHAFSKKLENFEAAVALHFAYYNFVRRHGSLRMTPAMYAGIERDFWSVGDLIEAAS
jgi:IS1 family transposase